MHSALKKLSFLIVITVLAASGCISTTKKIPLDQQLFAAQTRTRAELMQDLVTRSKAVSTMTATKVALDVSTKSDNKVKEFLQVAAIILVDRPRQVRLQVLAPFVGTTLADMVSDENQYKVSIPLKNQFGIFESDAPATSENALLNLRPKMILDSLFVDVMPYMDNPHDHPVVEEVTSGRLRFYVISFIDASAKDARLLEKIWIDRRSIEVSKKQVFAGDGKLETEVDYSAYQIVAGNMTFPQIISIQRPAEGYSVKITFQPAQLKFNQKLAAESFVLDRPAGSELLSLDKPGVKPF